MRPQRWVGVRRAGGNFEAVFLRENRALRVLARWPVELGDETPGRLSITDVAMDRVNSRAFVAICCEPVSGSVWWTDLRPGHRGPAFADQGHAVDVVGKTYARADTNGSIVIYPRGRESRRGAFRAASIAAHQVAVRPDGGQVVALIDPRRVNPPIDPGPVEILSVTRKADGGWKRVSTALSRRYCAVVYLTPTKVGLLRGKRSELKSLTCHGSRIDAFTLPTGLLSEGVLRLPETARHVNTDASGMYLIYTTRTGAIGWITRDGRRGGRLAHGRFVAADW